MDKTLKHDSQNLSTILSKVLNHANYFLQSLNSRPVGVSTTYQDISSIPYEGIGAENALNLFAQKYGSTVTGSAGSRYFGFVTGGTTPAAIAGDWLVSVFDQNVIGADDSCAPHVERETISYLRQLFNLSDAHFGTFVTGAMMSNFVSLAIARQWVARQLGIDVAKDGLYALPPIKILSAAPHSSIYKALSMLGMGRACVEVIASLTGREAIDIVELKKYLQSHKENPCIVVASAGTVNTADFDNLRGIVELKNEFNFWLHTDAAFGGFAACSPKYSYLVDGLDSADSITIDAHKWLNVPYDSAMQFTRHRQLQVEIFQNNAAYLGVPSENLNFVHLTPENSRRFRALPAWFSLVAYGQKGYQEIVERNCELAQLLGEKIKGTADFKLLAPMHLNVVCFTILIDQKEASAEIIKTFLTKLRDDGKVFLTPTVYKGIAGIRAALTNWRTESTDIEMAWQSLSTAMVWLKEISRSGDLSDYLQNTEY